MTDPPKILFVIDGHEFGGGERVFLQLASGLKGRFEVSFASMPGGRLEGELKSLGVNFYPVEMKRRISCKSVLRINEIIRNEQIDLVHSQGARADFFARIAGRMAGIPHNLCTIAMPVEGFDIKPLRKMIYRAFDRLTEGSVEKFIVVSDSLKRALIEKRRIPADRIVRIYNGIEIDQYHPGIESGNFKREWGISQNIPLVGAIGRMVWQKGFEYLIQSIPEIVKAVPEAKFLLVGEGPRRERLEALSEELRVRDNVILAGFRSDIKEILSAIDLLVVPSILEGFPMIILEAMAMGKPIVATNIDGIIEQITDGVDGILVPPKNPNALAEAILKIFSEEEKMKKIGLAARQKVESCFSVQKMVRETEQVYMSLLETN